MDRGPDISSQLSFCVLRPWLSGIRCCAPWSRSGRTLNSDLGSERQHDQGKRTCVSEPKEWRATVINGMHIMAMLALRSSSTYLKASLICSPGYSHSMKFEKCGHYYTFVERCPIANRKSPPTPCTSVHAPRATTVPKYQGVCPDRSKHPN